jgi:hypothetical protein
MTESWPQTLACTPSAVLTFWGRDFLGPRLFGAATFWGRDAAGRGAGGHPRQMPRGLTVQVGPSRDGTTWSCYFGSDEAPSLEARGGGDASGRSGTER